MIAYEFYIREDGEDHLIGVLPERRRNEERITQESIMNWGKLVLSDDAEVDLKALYFNKVKV